MQINEICQKWPAPRPTFGRCPVAAKRMKKTKKTSLSISGHSQITLHASGLMGTKTCPCQPIFHYLSLFPIPYFQFPVPIYGYIDIVQISATAYNPAALECFFCWKILFPCRTRGSGTPYSSAGSVWQDGFLNRLIQSDRTIFKIVLIMLVGFICFFRLAF